MESSEWDVFSKIGKQTPKPNDDLENLDELSMSWMVLTEEIESLTQRLIDVESELAHVSPEQAGEWAKSTGKHEIIVTRNERWVWDKDALESEFEANKLPDFVKRNLTIDKRKFQKLSASEQAKFRHALTRKLDKPKVKVIKNV